MITPRRRRSSTMQLQQPCKAAQVVGLRRSVIMPPSSQCPSRASIAQSTTCEQSLASNPENSRAFFGLARIARDQSDTEAAKRYAVRCYQTLSQDDEDFLR